MTKQIYILVGAPGSGKSWVANQIQDRFNYVPHDVHGFKSFSEYVSAITKQARNSNKPIVCETPFSLTQIMSPLNHLGFKVNPVFIVEKPEVTKERYEKRDGHEIPKGHLTRIETYKQRAKELNAPMGTSTDILEYMKQAPVDQPNE